MRTQIVIACIAWGLISVGCEDENDTSTATFAARGGGPASRDAGALERDAAVPANLSCGGLVGGSSCDPVTAWPCDTSHQNCGYSASAGAYVCVETPNQRRLCESCDQEDTFCGPGLLCSRRLGCTRLCCVDSDCSIGRCTLGAYNDDDVAAVGYCVEEGFAICLGLDAGTL